MVVSRRALTSKLDRPGILDGCDAPMARDRVGNHVGEYTPPQRFQFLQGGPECSDSRVNPRQLFFDSGHDLTLLDDRRDPDTPGRETTSTDVMYSDARGRAPNPTRLGLPKQVIVEILGKRSSMASHTNEGVLKTAPVDLCLPKCRLANLVRTSRRLSDNHVSGLQLICRTLVLSEIHLLNVAQVEPAPSDVGGAKVRAHA
jgi:hypothetical protein